MQTLADYTLPDDPSSVVSDQHSAKSTAGNNSLFSQMIQVIQMTYEFQSDVLAFAQALSDQISQLLPQIAAQCPDCCDALEQIMNTAPGKVQRDSNLMPSNLASPLDEDAASLQAVPVRPLAIHFTGREWEILHMMLHGLSNQEIADRLVIAVSTVKWYVNQLYGKLDVHSRDEAIYCAGKLIGVAPMPAHISQTFGRLAADEPAAMLFRSAFASKANMKRDTYPLAY